jgi:hypothetical protein
MPGAKGTLPYSAGRSRASAVTPDCGVWAISCCSVWVVAPAGRRSAFAIVSLIAMYASRCRFAFSGCYLMGLFVVLLG